MPQPEQYGFDFSQRLSPKDTPPRELKIPETRGLTRDGQIAQAISEAMSPLCKECDALGHCESCERKRSSIKERFKLGSNYDDVIDRLRDWVDPGAKTR